MAEITDMTLEEALNRSKWRPGVSWQAQMDARWEVMAAEIERLRNASTATALDLSGLTKWPTDAVAEMVDDPDGEEFGPWLREADILATLQPPSGQVWKMIELDLNVIDRLAHYETVAPNWDTFHNISEAVRRIREALRQPVETDGMTLEQWVRMDDLRTQPQAPVTPDGYLFQHGETGRTTFVMPDEVDSFSRDNPRWSKVGPMYRKPQATVVADERTVREQFLADGLFSDAWNRGNHEEAVNYIVNALRQSKGVR